MVNPRVNFFLVILPLVFVVSCGEPAKQAVPKLVEKLQSADKSERNSAALALAKYGVEAKDAVPALIVTLRDPNPGIRTSAAYALRSIGTEEATEALERAEAREAARR